MLKRLAVLGALLVTLGVVLYAQATYPSGIASFTTRVNGSVIDASWFNGLQNEVIAIETGLINGFQHVLKPQADNTYDLGTSSLTWRNLYVKGTVYQGSTNPYTGWTVVTSTNTGTQNDFAPGLVGNTVVRMNNASLATITGFAGGYDGERLIVQSVGAGEVDLSSQDTGSIAANREITFVTTASAKTPMAAGAGVAELIYDGTASRWRLLHHEQGAWITRTFAAGNYTTNGAGGVTVTGGEVVQDGYWLRDRTLTFAVYLVGITVTAATGTEIRVTLPGGLASNRRMGQFVNVNDNGTNKTGVWDVQPSVGYVRFFVDQTTTNPWTASATNTNIEAITQFEVQ